MVCSAKIRKYYVFLLIFTIGYIAECFVDSGEGKEKGKDYQCQGHSMRVS
jgi:hypothetical protein